MRLLGLILEGHVQLARREGMEVLSLANVLALEVNGEEMGLLEKIWMA